MIFIIILKVCFAIIAILAVFKLLFNKKARKDNPDAMDGLNSLGDIL